MAAPSRAAGVCGVLREKEKGVVKRFFVSAIAIGLVGGFVVGEVWGAQQSPAQVARTSNFTAALQNKIVNWQDVGETNKYLVSSSAPQQAVYPVKRGLEMDSTPPGLAFWERDLHYWLKNGILMLRPDPEGNNTQVDSGGKHFELWCRPCYDANVDNAWHPPRSLVTCPKPQAGARALPAPHPHGAPPPSSVPQPRRRQPGAGGPGPQQQVPPQPPHPASHKPTDIKQKMGGEWGAHERQPGSRREQQQREDLLQHFPVGWKSFGQNNDAYLVFKVDQLPAYPDKEINERELVPPDGIQEPLAGHAFWKKDLNFWITHGVSMLRPINNPSGDTTVRKTKTWEFNLWCQPCFMAGSDTPWHKTGSLATCPPPVQRRGAPLPQGPPQQPQRHAAPQPLPQPVPPRQLQPHPAAAPPQPPHPASHKLTSIKQKLVLLKNKVQRLLGGRRQAAPPVSLQAHAPVPPAHPQLARGEAKLPSRIPSPQPPPKRVTVLPAAPPRQHPAPPAAGSACDPQGIVATYEGTDLKDIRIAQLPADNEHFWNARENSDQKISSFLESDLIKKVPEMVPLAKCKELASWVQRLRPVHRIRPSTSLLSALGAGAVLANDVLVGISESDIQGQLVRCYKARGGKIENSYSDFLKNIKNPTQISRGMDKKTKASATVMAIFGYNPGVYGRDRDFGPANIIFTQAVAQNPFSWVTPISAAKQLSLLREQHNLENLDQWLKANSFHCESNNFGLALAQSILARLNLAKNDDPNEPLIALAKENPVPAVKKKWRNTGRSLIRTDVPAPSDAAHSLPEYHLPGIIPLTEQNIIAIVTPLNVNLLVALEKLTTDKLQADALENMKPSLEKWISSVKTLFCEWLEKHEDLVVFVTTKEFLSLHNLDAKNLKLKNLLIANKDCVKMVISKITQYLSGFSDNLNFDWYQPADRENPWGKLNPMPTRLLAPDQPLSTLTALRRQERGGIQRSQSFSSLPEEGIDFGGIRIPSNQGSQWQKRFVRTTLAKQSHVQEQ